MSVRNEIVNRLDVKSVIEAFDSHIKPGDLNANTAKGLGGDYIKLATESSFGRPVMIREIDANMSGNGVDRNSNIKNFKANLDNTTDSLTATLCQSEALNRTSRAALKLAAESAAACLDSRALLQSYANNLRTSLKNTSLTENVIQSSSGNDGLNIINRIYMDADAKINDTQMNTFDPITMSTESFDGQHIHNHMLFNYALNALSIGTDPVLAAAYPVTPIAANASNIRYEFLYTTIIDQYQHQIDGTYTKKPYHKLPELLNIYNDKFWNNNFLKVIPRWVENTAGAAVADGNEALFVSALRYEREDGAEPVTTAPIKLNKPGYNKTFGLLGTSQTEAQLSGKGQYDRTDALSSQVGIRSIYFALQDGNTAWDGTTGAEVLTSKTVVAGAEFYEIEVDGIYQSQFNPTINDGNSFKEISINTSEQIMFIRSDTTLAKQEDKVNTILTNTITNAGGTGIYHIGIPVTMSGKITLDDGVINNFNINVNLDHLEVYSKLATPLKNGDTSILLPKTDPIYQAILALFEDTTKFQFVGYELNAVRTNSNIREGGRTLSLDKTSTTFAVGFKSGNEFILPPDDSIGDENDTELILSGRVSSTSTFINNIGMVQFLEDIKKVKKIAGSGIGSIRDVGSRALNQFSIALKGVRPYYHEETYDIKSNLTATVDVDRIPNIQANILNKIGLLAADMALASNYLVCWRNNFGGARQGNPTIFIACHEKLARILTVGKQEGEFIPDVNGYSINIKIVSTIDPRVGNNIFMFFSDPNRGEGDGSFDPLSFGFCPMAPIITHNFQRTENGRIVKHIQTQMRFENLICCPIVTVIPVTGFEEAFGPISVPVRGIGENDALLTKNI